jgi:hypothetical protein
MSRLPLDYATREDHEQRVPTPVRILSVVLPALTMIMIVVGTSGAVPAWPALLVATGLLVAAIAVRAVGERREVAADGSG